MRDPNGARQEESTVREWDPETELTVAVVTTVAELRGTAPDALTPLSEAIDPDAVQALFEGDGDPVVQFEYEDCVVTVDSRSIAVVPPEHRIE